MHRLLRYDVMRKKGLCCVGVMGKGENKGIMRWWRAWTKTGSRKACREEKKKKKREGRVIVYYSRQQSKLAFFL